MVLCRLDNLLFLRGKQMRGNQSNLRSRGASISHWFFRTHMVSLLTCAIGGCEVSESFYWEQFLAYLIAKLAVMNHKSKSDIQTCRFYLCPISHCSLTGFLAALINKNYKTFVFNTLELLQYSMVSIIRQCRLVYNHFDFEIVLYL